MTITNIRSELKKSMLQKDTERTGVIRMLLSAISYSAMSGNKKDEEMSEEDINSVILKELKLRTEAIEEFQANGKIDLAMKEKSEIEIVKEFAPKLMDETETKKAIQELLVNADPNIQFGPAMGLVMKNYKGKVDNSLVGKVLQELLKK